MLSTAYGHGLAGTANIPNNFVEKTRRVLWHRCADGWCLCIFFMTSVTWTGGTASHEWRAGYWLAKGRTTHNTAKSLLHHSIPLYQPRLTVEVPFGSQWSTEQRHDTTARREPALGTAVAPAVEHFTGQPSCLRRRCNVAGFPFTNLTHGLWQGEDTPGFSG